MRSCCRALPGFRLVACLEFRSVFRIAWLTCMRVRPGGLSARISGRRSLHKCQPRKRPPWRRRGRRRRRCLLFEKKTRQSTSKPQLLVFEQKHRNLSDRWRARRSIARQRSPGCRRRMSRRTPTPRSRLPCSTIGFDRGKETRLRLRKCCQRPQGSWRTRTWRLVFRVLFVFSSRRIVVLRCRLLLLLCGVCYLFG